MHVSTRLSVLVGIIAPALCYNADRINVTDATPETYHEVERIVPTQWEIEVFPGGQNETLSGTIEQAIREAQDHNPEFRAYNAPPVETSKHKPPPLGKSKYKRPPLHKNKSKLKPDHGNVAAHAAHARAVAVAGDEWPPADHPMFRCDMEGIRLGFRKKPLCPDRWRPDEECYRVRPWWVGCNAPADSPGDGAVQCYNQSPAGANKTTIKYNVYTMLERYPGPDPTVAGGNGTCSRVSCSYGSAVYLCNTREEPGTLPSWTHVGAGAFQVADKCKTAGHANSARGKFFKDFWAVEVKSEKCEEDADAEGGDMLGMWEKPT
ncbi:hypothetical protein PG988_007763 [Apiospora saccharicola]